MIHLFANALSRLASLASLALGSPLSLASRSNALMNGPAATRNFLEPWMKQFAIPNVGGKIVAREGMLAGPGSFNAAIWSRSMAARFPETWREKRIRVEIPDVVDNSTLIQAQARVSAAIAGGKLDTEGGTVLSKLLTDLGTSMERLEIEKRLAAIEERLGSKR